MKTVGIVADNYKIARFKKELSKNGFSFKIYPFVKETSTIKVTAEESRIKEIAKICQLIELHFKRSN